MKKSLFIAVAAAALIICTGCTGKNNTAGSSSYPENVPAASDFKDVSAGGWTVIMEDTMRKDKLENVTLELGYTNTAENKFVQQAPAGKEYFLVKLNLAKGTSTENLEWDKLLLTDANGEQYKRTEDSFISELGMKRLPGTDLNFGANEGWIAYEINKDAAGLKLSYEFKNDKLVCEF